MIEAGQPAPEFTLRNQDGGAVSLSEFRGKRVLIVFYPFDFSSVCSDQLSAYQEILPQLEENGVEMIGISIDHPYAHKAFQEKLGIETTLLADFEPKGEVARAYGSYVDAIGMANRTLVLIDADGNIEWTHESPSPGEMPPPQLILDALQR
jgi:peroxiredoxin